MEQEERLKYLKIVLNVIGVMFIVGLPAMMMWIWPSGWGWGWTPPPARVRTHDNGGLRYVGCVFDPGCKRPFS